MQKRLRWQWRRLRSGSWRIDETYVRIRGRWTSLYCALDKFANTLDFYLSSTRNTEAAKRFHGKALRGLKEWEQPEVLSTDKAPTYAVAIAELKAEGKCPNETSHRQVKYLTNVVETDHGKLKLLIRPVRGFKTLKPAYVTIKGFELRHRRPWVSAWQSQPLDRNLRSCRYNLIRMGSPVAALRGSPGTGPLRRIGTTPERRKDERRPWRTEWR